MKGIAKLARLSRVDRGLLVRAGILVPLVRMGLSFYSFERVQRALSRFSRPVASTAKNQEDSTVERVEGVERVVWAVRAASRYVPAASCLTQALAAHTLLERRGLQNALRIGVARNEAGVFEAHAWIESDGEVVLGKLHDLDRYTPLPSLQRKDAR